MFPQSASCSRLVPLAPRGQLVHTSEFEPVNVRRHGTQEKASGPTEIFLATHILTDLRAAVSLEQLRTQQTKTPAWMRAMEGQLISVSY